MQQKDFNSSCRGLNDLLETSKSLVGLWPNTGQCIPRLSLLQSVPFIHYTHTFVHPRRETMCPSYQSVIRLWYLSTFKSCGPVWKNRGAEEKRFWILTLNERLKGLRQRLPWIIDVIFSSDVAVICCTCLVDLLTHCSLKSGELATPNLSSSDV